MGDLWEWQSQETPKDPKGSPYSQRDREELNPSWARPWARLAVAAEGMEEPRPCSVDQTNPYRKIHLDTMGYNILINFGPQLSV